MTVTGWRCRGARFPGRGFGICRPRVRRARCRSCPGRVISEAPPLGLLLGRGRILATVDRRQVTVTFAASSRRGWTGQQPHDQGRTAHAAIVQVLFPGSRGYGTIPGMDNIQAQIRELQATVTELRERLDALQRGDATFDTITCKGWQVVDKDGKERITAATDADGLAAVFWADKNGKVRIAVTTHADGDASVRWADKNGRERITAQTQDDGLVGVFWADKNGKDRIAAQTLADGSAGVVWLDKDGRERMAAGTLADGTVIYPAKDGK